MARKSDTKRQHILSVAAQAFQELGLERTTMSEICARVGGSKATLYNYFSSKEELFFEVMNRSTEAEFEAVYSAVDPSTEDIASSLRNFGERLLGILYSPRVRANRHLAISASGHTQLGRVVYERGVQRGQKLVSDFLREAMGLGKLRQADPVVATKHLYSLLEAELIDRFLFQLLGEVSEEEIKLIADRAIDVFMAAYGFGGGK
ncbi:TetR/AcrR family transcriptional regulator [Citrifermentans bremense]|uniref:TetR/AcrR family transcriptional regulator n=1 Tax=Citrifermentans bremense TaxID=60035 RepID=UPI00040E251A|nr:TetR/AcrR family transcriptional regulator [Citrifermentans bremense]